MAELFAQHEINRAALWPRLSKVVVGSLVFHLLLGVTLKYVPVARGIFSIVRGAAGVEFVDEDYQRTNVQDQVTMLTLPGGKFQYPDGFFSAGEEFAPPPPLILPVSTPPIIPLPKPVAQLPTPAPLPSIPASGNVNGDKGGQFANPTLPPLDKQDGKIAKNQPVPTPTPAVSPTPDAKARETARKDAANKELDRIAAEKNLVRPRRDKMNMKPFDNLWGGLNQAHAQQTLNWESNVEVELVGERASDNTLQNLRRVNLQGDPALAKMFTDFIVAAGDSGALQFLQGPTEFRFNLKLEGQKFTARILAPVASPEAATELARTYGAMLLAGKIAKKGDKEEVYFNNANIKAEGTNLVINFSLQRDETKKLINEQLASAADKAQTKQQPTQTPLK